MRPNWRGREVFIVERRKDRQAVHSTRYLTTVDNGTSRGQKFDLYIPDAIFGDFDGPPTLQVTIESINEDPSLNDLSEMFEALATKLK